MRVPSLPGSLGTTRLVTQKNYNFFLLFYIHMKLKEQTELPTEVFGHKQKEIKRGYRKLRNQMFLYL